MKTISASLALSLAAVGWCLHSASVTAGAVGLPQSSSDPTAEVQRVYSIIRQDSGISSADPLPLPVIKTDPQGKIWAAWETWETGRSRVRLASFGSAGIESVSTLGRPEGNDLLPDLAFSADGRPWATWVNSQASETSVVVMDVAGQRIWSVGRESAASITSPRVVIDPRGPVWAFWNVTAGSTGEIVYRRLEGQTWTAPALVRRLTGWPAVNPDAGLDPSGTLWLTWSGYDGTGYRIYLTRWTGAGWTREAAVSRNAGANLFPALAFDAQGLPLVSWVSAADRRREIRLSVFKNGRATEESVLDTQPDRPGPPRFIQRDGQASIILKSGDGLRVQSITPAFLSGLTSAAAAPAPRLLDNPKFDENKYAGIGDSITFGYVDYYPYPERGYIPRLNTILEANYGSQRVVNEGWGGEVTAEGLVRIDRVFIADLARYILIMEGTNDVVFEEISIDSSAFNLRQMVRKCLAAGAFPAIATILPRYDDYGVQPVFHSRILSLNTKIRQVAADLAVPLVDMYAAFSGYPAANGGVLSLLSKDLKHPSDKGYQFMAETWFSEIRNFPFPPVNLNIEKSSPERLQRTSPRGRLNPAPRTSSPAPSDPRQLYGNRLTWAASPKIFDPGRVLGYRIYRKKSAAAGTFQFLTFVQAPLEFFDRGIAAVGSFSYAISTLRQDGVEGAVVETAGK